MRPAEETVERAILLVEDEADIREVLGDMLADGDYAVTCAGTCAEARDRLEACSFALVITDVRLPDGSGADLARFVQERGMKSLVITGDANQMQRLELRGQPYLAKPFRTTDLLARVERLLSPRPVSQPELAAAGAKPGAQARKRNWLPF
jgi:two-component system OmpR family response regulator